MIVQTYLELGHFNGNTFNNNNDDHDFLFLDQNVVCV